MYGAAGGTGLGVGQEQPSDPGAQDPRRTSLGCPGFPDLLGTFLQGRPLAQLLAGWRAGWPCPPQGEQGDGEGHSVLNSFLLKDRKHQEGIQPPTPRPAGVAGTVLWVKPDSGERKGAGHRLESRTFPGGLEVGNDDQGPKPGRGLSQPLTSPSLAYQTPPLQPPGPLAPPRP